jgi:hypothetical protein
VQAAQLADEHVGNVEGALPLRSVPEHDGQQLIVAETRRPEPIELFARAIVLRNPLHVTPPVSDPRPSQSATVVIVLHRGRGADGALPADSAIPYTLGMFLLRGASRWALLLLALAVTACAEPPTKEMDQAQGAIDAAQAAGASEYAAQELLAARTSLEKSHDAAGQRDYRLALNYALDARERAQDAARQAADEKARARGAAEKALQAVELAFVESRELARKARQAQLAPSAISALTSASSAAGKALQEARARLEAQRYRDVSPPLDETLPRLREANAEIERLLAAPRARRPAGRARRE